MMEPVKIVFFYILIQRTVYFAAFAADEESNSRSAHFTPRKNKRLQGYVVQRFESPSLMSCSQLCLRNSWCTSTNFKMSSRDDDKGTCELNKHNISLINEDTEFHDQKDVTFSLLLKVSWLEDFLYYEICQHCYSHNWINDRSCIWNAMKSWVIITVIRQHSVKQ